MCCHNCALECPVGAIDYVHTKYAIDQDKCIQCGKCYDICNISAVENTEEPKPVAHDPIHKTADLVVIGCGGSGSIAAVRAAEATGKKVIVLEKAKKFGGSAWYAGFGVRKADKNAPPRPDPYERFGGKISRGILQLVETAPQEFSDWMLTMDGVSDYWQENEVETPFGPSKMVGLKERVFYNLKARDEAIGPGHGGCFVVKTMVEQFPRLGIELLTETGATSLKVTDGKISGVVAQDPGGVVEIDCKAVVVAAGSFAHNDELLRTYWPWFFNNDQTAEPVHRFAVPTNTGDVVKLADSIGAWVDYDNFTVNLFGPVHHPFSFCLFKFACEPEMVAVNLEGKRFYDESFFPNGAEKIGDQPGRIAWSILDQDTLEVIAQRLIAGPDGWIHKDYMQDIQRELALEQPLKKGDTLEELAEACGIPGDALAKTIATYNADCEAGVDSEFGKKPEAMRPVKKGPFYAIYGKMATDGAFGGIRVNEKMEGLKKDGTPIPGLYVTGDNAAGWAVRVDGPGDHREMATNEMSWAVSSGFTAGGSVAEYLTKE
jgi:fumarate reductase flavoprotein subunit